MSDMVEVLVDAPHIHASIQGDQLIVHYDDTATMFEVGDALALGLQRGYIDIVGQWFDADLNREFITCSHKEQ